MRVAVSRIVLYYGRIHVLKQKEKCITGRLVYKIHH